MAIFIKPRSRLIEMTEQPDDAEDVLQQLLADQPDLLVGDWMATNADAGCSSSARSASATSRMPARAGASTICS
jgi:hypothetical protein